MSGVFNPMAIGSGVGKSHQSLNEVYFWTSVIKDWKQLIKEDEMKIIRNYIFWQRDRLAILITDRIMSGAKLDYMHYNPLQPHWQLCNDPLDYRFSSARFYETGEDEFKILTHYMDRL